MERIEVLLLEDNSGDAYLVKDQLRNSSDLDFSIAEAQYLEQAVTLLGQQSFDVILLDLMLPDSQGLETFFAVNRHAPDTAIIVISAMSEKKLAIQAVKDGAQDYIPKGDIQPHTLVKTIQYAIERKSITEQLKKRTLELEYLNQELEAFSYTVSHDLKNPLSFIKGMSSLLLGKKRSRPLDAKDRLCIERIYKSSINMEQITKNLLSLSQAQRMQMSVGNINLSELVAEVADELQRQLKRQVNFIITPNIMVRGDQHLLKLAVENLIGNAVKYSQNTPNSLVEFGIKEDEEHVVYYIKDNGIGFRAEEATELFKPFRRLSNSKDFEGTGIGLATVKRVIDRHQGEIWFEAQPEQGACFFFTLKD